MPVATWRMAKRFSRSLLGFQQLGGYFITYERILRDRNSISIWIQQKDRLDLNRGPGENERVIFLLESIRLKQNSSDNLWVLEVCQM